MTELKQSGWWLFVGVVLAFALTFQQPALAERRVALVIGNAAYEHTAALGNPRNDASDMAAALADLGFDVTQLENASYRELRRSLQHFRRAAAEADVALVFYAGHGIEVERTNFLVPVDAELKSDEDVAFEAVPLDLVLRSVEGAGQLRLVILDACRDNPFAGDWRRQGASRSTLQRGLARVEPSGDTLVAYAAREGTTAADGSGRNSPYTAALLQHIAEPGVEIDLLFRKVRDSVLETTGGRQEPFVYGSRSSRNFYFVPPPEETEQSAEEEGDEPAGPTQQATLFDERQFDLALWQATQESGSIAAYEAYLRQYPEGIFAAMATLKIDELRRSEVVAALAGPREDPELPLAEAPAESGQDLADVDDAAPDAGQDIAGGDEAAAGQDAADIDEAAAAAADDTAASEETAALEVASVAVEPGPAENEAALALSRADRRLIQLALNDLGHQAGVVDGLLGPRSRFAIEGWQRADGAAGTGYLSRAQATTLVLHGKTVEPVVAAAAPEQEPRLMENPTTLTSAWGDSFASALSGASVNAVRAAIDRCPTKLFLVVGYQATLDRQHSGADTARRAAGAAASQLVAQGVPRSSIIVESRPAQASTEAASDDAAGSINPRAKIWCRRY